MLVFITIVAVVAAVLCAAQAWRLTHDARPRPAAIDSTHDGLTTSPFGEGNRGAAVLHPFLKAGLGLAAVVAPIVVVAAAGDLLGRSPEATESCSTVLALLAMQHAREPQSLTVTGLVRNQGRAQVQRVTAVVLVFDRDGQVVASAHAPLERQTLSPRDESAFRVAIPRVAEVGRYRVSFENDDGVVRHVDRRAESEGDRPGASGSASRTGAAGALEPVTSK